MSFLINFPLHSSFYIMGGELKYRNHLLTQILLEYYQVTNGVIINADTDITDAIVNSHTMQNCKFYNNYEPKITKQFLSTHKLDYINNPNKRNFYCFLEMDKNNDWKSDIQINDLFMSHQKLNTSFCISSQKPLQLSNLLKSNIDYVCIFPETNMDTRKYIFNNYASNNLMSYTIFSTYMNYLKPHNCLILNNRANNIQFFIHNLFDGSSKQLIDSFEYEKNIIGVCKLRNFHKKIKSNHSNKNNINKNDLITNINKSDLNKNKEELNKDEICTNKNELDKGEIDTNKNELNKNTLETNINKNELNKGDLNELNENINKDELEIDINKDDYIKNKLNENEVSELNMVDGFYLV